MSRRMSIYLTDQNMLRFDQVSSCAEAKGKTSIDELLDGYEKYVEMKKKQTNSEGEVFKPYNLDLGHETKREFSFVSFYGKKIFSRTFDGSYFVEVYQGRKGSYLVYFLGDDGWADYKIIEILDEVADFIAYGIYEKRGLDWEYTEDGTQEQYLDIANEFCKEVGLVMRGNEVKFLEF